MRREVILRALANQLVPFIVYEVSTFQYIYKRSSYQPDINYQI